MPSVVFDTVIFVRALINPHDRWGELVFRYFPRYTLVISGPLLIELLDVLRRPEVNQKFRVFPGLDIDRVLALVGQARLAEVGPVALVSRDAKDDKFQATARAGGASYVVTEDDDLLILGEDEGVQIIDALHFLRILEQEGEPR